MKRIAIRKGNKPFSMPATIGFLVLATACVVGCVMIISNMLNRQTATLPSAEPTPSTPAMTTPGLEDSSEAAAIIVPEESVLPPTSPTPDEGAASPSPTSQPTPSPTPMPAINAPALTSSRMVFAILGFDESDSADVVSIVSIDKGACTVLSLPRNTLCSESAAIIADTTAASQALKRMTSVFPLSLKYYIELDMKGLADCVDAFGGVALGGTLKSGSEVVAYLDAGGSDELLRITRQQSLLHALAARLQEVGLIRLLAGKHTLQKYARGNFDSSQYLALYSALRQLDTDKIRFLTLPVDSHIQDGQRYYKPDRQLSESLARELFG